MLHIKKRSASQVPNASAGKVFYFIDSTDGKPKVKDETGAVLETIGAKGDPGDDGTNGLSAYELAVTQGFSGTLSEWLLSLGGTPPKVYPSAIVPAPSTITGLIASFDFSDPTKMTIEDNKISTIQGSDSTLITLTNTEPDQRPSLITSNGKTCAQFTSSLGTFLKAENLNLTSDASFVVIYEAPTPTVEGTIIDKGNINYGNGLGRQRINTGLTGISVKNANDVAAVSYVTAAGYKAGLHMHIASFSKNEYATLSYLDGSQYSPIGPLLTPGNITVHDTLTLGSTYSSDDITNSFNGIIHRVLVYNRRLNSEDLKAINTWVLENYPITLRNSYTLSNKINRDLHKENKDNIYFGKFNVNTDIGGVEAANAINVSPKQSVFVDNEVIWVAPAAGTYKISTKPLAKPVDVSNGSIILDHRCVSLNSLSFNNASLTGFYIELHYEGTESSLSSNFISSVNIAGDFKQKSYPEIYTKYGLNIHEFRTLNGTATLDKLQSITHIVIRMVTSAAGIPIALKSIFMQPNTKDKCQLIFTMDGCKKSAINKFIPALEKYGFKGNLRIYGLSNAYNDVSNTNPDFGMTRREIVSVFNKGHNVSLSSQYENEDSVYHTGEEIINDISKGIDDLYSLGIKQTFDGALFGSAAGGNYVNTIAKRFLQRSSIKYYFAGGGSQTLETYPPSEPYAIRTNGLNMFGNYNINSTVITGFTISNGGAGITTATVIIGPPNIPTGRQATAVATIVGGVITQILPTDRGEGYTSAPTVTIISDGTTPAVATAVTRVNPLKQINVTNGGQNYTNATVTLSTGGGTATPVIVGGVITAINLTGVGNNHTSTPTVTINGDGTGATAVAVVDFDPLTVNSYVSHKALLDKGALYRQGLIYYNLYAEFEPVTFGNSQLLVDINYAVFDRLLQYIKSQPDKFDVITVDQISYDAEPRRNYANSVANKNKFLSDTDHNSIIECTNNETILVIPEGLKTKDFRVRVMLPQYAKLKIVGSGKVLLNDSSSSIVRYGYNNNSPIEIIAKPSKTNSYQITSLAPVVKLNSPTNFGYTLPFNIFSQDSNYFHNFLMTDYIPTGGNILYINPSSGNDATAVINDRTKPALNLSVALARTDIDRIIIIGLTSNFIARTVKSWNNSDPVKSISVEVEGDFRYISVPSNSASAHTFTATANRPGVYQTAATAANSGSVVDFSITETPSYEDNDGVTTILSEHPPIYKVLTKVTSVAQVASTPGSWYNDGTNTYIRAHDTRNLASAGTAMQILTTAINGKFSTNKSNVNIYLKGIDFVGGIPFIANTGTTATATAGPSGDKYITLTSTTNLVPGMNITGPGIPDNTTIVNFNGLITELSNNLTQNFSSTANAYKLSYNNNRLVFDNCSFQSSTPLTSDAPNGLFINGDMFVVSYKCGSYNNGADGYKYRNYENDNGVTTHTSPTFIEIECAALRNGTTGDTGIVNNASGAYDRSVGIRLNGYYINSDDRVIDNNHFSKTWNIGGFYGQALKTTPGNESICALGNSNVWIEGVNTKSGPNPRYIATVDATLYYRNVSVVVNAGTAEATGTISKYTNPIIED